MKHLVLLAIVATSIIGATTAFASSNFINITGVQTLGASADVNIQEDIHAASIDFVTCESTPTAAGVTPGTSGPCPNPSTSSGVVYGISECTVTDKTDTAIPNGEIVTCKLTEETCNGTPFPGEICFTPTTTNPGPNVVGEGSVTVAITGTTGAFVSNIGGTVNAAGTAVDCSVTTAPCVIHATIAGGPIDIQTVGDVKVVAKGPTV